LSERNLWIVNLGEICNKFVKTNGLLVKTFELLLRNLDLTKVEKSDRFFTIPHIDIQSPIVNNGTITMIVGNQTWEISPLFKDYIQTVLTAINLARQGKVGALFDPLVPNESTNTTPQQQSNGEDAFQAIEKLKKLFYLGAITQIEFDKKKEDLLGRI
jgi:hypothetical protein